MKDRHRGAVGLIALAGLCAGTSVLACGDKFLVAGRGARFQRGGSHALVVVIYAPPSSTLAGGAGSVEKVLSRAGYHPAVAASPEELGKVLADSNPGVVLADITDAPAVAKVTPSGKAAPTVVPVLGNATREGLAEARKTWGVALKASSSGDSLLDAVDEAVELRAKAQKGIPKV
jgi:hypothetical protein